MVSKTLYTSGSGQPLPKWKQVLKQSGVLWALLALCVIASISSPYFLQPENLINIVRQMAIVGIVSIGMTFVILTAGIDLSVGSIIAVVAVVCADMLQHGVPQPVVLISGLFIGALFGGINGIGITNGKIPAFIMTLGMMVAGRGIAMTFSKGQPVSLGTASQDFYWLGGGSWLGVPVPVIILGIMVVLAILLLNYTAFGRAVYAIGDNPEAARLSGINNSWIVFNVYVISGVLSGLTGLILISRLTVGEPTAGTGYELDAIAMVVIGGTSLFGGEGGIRGTMIGAAIVVVIANILNLLGVSPFTQQIVKGLIIVLAVLLERRKRS